MPKKTPKTKSPEPRAQAEKQSAVELSEQQLDQVAGGVVIREKMLPPTT
jgi:hypothetical protein